MFTNPNMKEEEHVLIQSNSLRGDFAHRIVERSMNEIHDLMVTVFGPYATDAWIIKSDKPYYTRDGLEVFSSMSMDHKLAHYVQQILFQAAENQARKVGDGTTTLFVMYTNLYNRLAKAISAMSGKHSLTVLRNTYNEVVSDINIMLSNESVPMTDDMLRSMIYTCTQDAELSALIDGNIHNELMNKEYIVVEKSNIETDLRVAVHDRPLIKATKVYESIPTPPNASGVIKNASILFVNGVLDLSHVDTLKGLSNIRIGKEFSPSIVIICSGLTESTRRVIKEFSGYIATGQAENPIYIFSIDNFVSYTKEEIDDIIAYVYDRNGTSGLDNSTTFEAHLFQAFVPKSVDVDGDRVAETLRKFDAAIANITDMRNAICAVRSVEYVPGEGLMLDDITGPMAKQRYEELRDSIAKEKSSIKRMEIEQRIRKLFGKFIEVQVGSKLVKDSQRKFELVLDAVVSAGTAVEDGVLKTNSIYLAIDIIETMKVAHPEYMLSAENPMRRSLLNAIEDALVDTLNNMIKNRFPDMSEGDINTMIFGSFKRKDEDGNIITDRAFDLNRETIIDVFDPSLPIAKIATDDGTEIDTQIVEPVTVMTTLLENSTMILELVCAKAFNLDGYMNNYIS